MYTLSSIICVNKEQLYSSPRALTLKEHNTLTLGL